MEIMLTTVDNPYDPFTQFDDWFAFDEQMGYHSCSLLDRFAVTSPDLDEKTNFQELNDAMDRIIELYGSDVYKKMVKK